ncbi:methyltransferase [Sneathiella sp.]|uniref:tRNA1(Val) (adenine(37)-N6)-methyltransferase n=1 Tax=Sneathiella sp. TaxID=1964365 RepID=UPI00260BE684|nr:methyltransferase [Sneathiella sp.]MDF2366824.1 methyltransferase [Sneathiella sp.]
MGQEQPNIPLKKAVDYTDDHFLGNALKITQPKEGFRAGSDAVLLAAMISAKAGESLLDVGCGVGTAGFCALHRLPDCHLWGLELQGELVALARLNAEQNSFVGRSSFIEADIGARTSFAGMDGPGGKPFLEAGFDHVFTNPPFYGKGRARSAKTEIKTLAHIEGSVALPEWLQFCVARAKSKGTVTVIHRADRLGDILVALQKGCGRIRVVPLWPEAGQSAKRVIVQGIKGDKSPLELTRGLVLHEKDGTPTAAATAIAREGAALKSFLE